MDESSHLHHQAGHPYSNIYNPQSGGKYGTYLLLGSTQPNNNNNNAGGVSSIYKKDYSKNKLDGNNSNTSYNNSSTNHQQNISNNNINSSSSGTGASTGIGITTNTNGNRDPASGSKLLMGNPSSHLFGYGNYGYKDKDKESSAREGGVGMIGGPSAALKNYKYAAKPTSNALYTKYLKT